MSKLDATSLARQVMNEAMAVSRLIADLVSGDVQVHKASGWGHVCAWLCSTVIVMQRVLDMDDSMEAEFAKRLLLLSHAVANTRFAFEEFGTVAPAQRVVQRNNHCVAVEQGMGWVVHRVNRLTQSMGVDWRPYRRDVKAIVFNPEHPLKNAEMQLLWRTFFGKRLVVTRRELFAAIQNDLRDRGVAMYSPKELKFVGQLIDTATEEVLSAQELQTFFNIWGATLPDAGASALVDVVAAARRNVFYLLPDGQRQEWFVAPWMQPFFNNSDMYWTLKDAEPHSYLLRYSSIEGCFVVHWVSAGRSLRCARIYSMLGGFNWRMGGNPKPLLQDLIKAVRVKLHHTIVLPQPADGPRRLLIADDDD